MAKVEIDCSRDSLSNSKLKIVVAQFFEHVSALKPPHCLSVRSKRRTLTQKVTNLIQEGDNPEEACKNIIEVCSVFHNYEMQRNGYICAMENSHYLLFVAAKLCFDFSVSDKKTIASLLDSIFACEKTFEKLLVAAVVGMQLTSLLSGWRSDFANDEECLRAVEYFADHAVASKLMYQISNDLYSSSAPFTSCRFIDVPLTSYNSTCPLFMASYMCRPKCIRLLLRYGARININKRNSGDPIAWCPVYIQLNNLNTHAQRNEDKRTISYPVDSVECLHLLFRSLPRVPICLQTETKSKELQESDDENEFYLNEKGYYLIHPRLHSDNIVNPSFWLHPASLKHLCRCVIRHTLNKNWKLPKGIYDLDLPVVLKQYIDLEED